MVEPQPLPNVDGSTTEDQGSLLQKARAEVHVPVHKSPVLLWARLHGRCVESLGLHASWRSNCMQKRQSQCCLLWYPFAHPVSIQMCNGSTLKRL